MDSVAQTSSRTADLAGPVTGGILVASDLLEKHYIDIQYNDLNNVGLNKRHDYRRCSGIRGQN